MLQLILECCELLGDFLSFPTLLLIGRLANGAVQVINGACLRYIVVVSVTWQ